MVCKVKSEVKMLLKMNKILSYIVIVIAAMTLVACGPDKPRPKRGTTLEIVPTTKVPKKTVNCGMGFSFCKKTRECNRPVALMRDGDPKTIKVEFDKKCN